MAKSRTLQIVGIAIGLCFVAYLIDTQVSRSQLGGEVSTQRERTIEIERLAKQYQRNYKESLEISVKEFKQLQNKQRVVLVDVRSAEEREVSQIPGAMTKDDFEKQIEEFKSATIVTYCTIGVRSARYAAKLKQRGFSVFNLSGSILAWVNANGALVTVEQKPTKRVHVYGRKWNILPNDYEAVW